MSDNDDKQGNLIDPSGRKRIILSVDGGGMRGTIPIAMLAKLEEKMGKPCNELFDMVVGTSTGAIIAVGLAVGHSAKYLLEEVYLSRLPRAFREGKNRGWLIGSIAKMLNLIVPLGEDFLAGLLAHRFHFAYAMNPFREELAPLLYEKNIYTARELPKKPCLLVTTKDVSNGESYFIVSAGPGKTMFEDWPLAGVVAASGAAPIYFPSVLWRFIDGGVGVYSNPCLAAATEAIEYLDFKREETILLSLGTGYTENRVTEEQAQKYSVVDWARYTIWESIDDTALQQVFMTRAIYGLHPKRECELAATGTSSHSMDIRRYNPLLRRDSVQGELGISLKKGQDPSHLSLDSFQESDVHLMKNIGKQYAEHIDWSKANTMPWETKGGHPQCDLKKYLKDYPVNWEKSEYDPKRGLATSSTV